jgi:hypothetical protein
VPLALLTAALAQFWFLEQGHYQDEYWLRISQRE